MKQFKCSMSKKIESLAKKSEDASSVDDLLARHNQKWLVKVSYDVDASHSAVAPSIVRADTKDAATNIALKRHRGLGDNMKVVSVEPMTESRKKSEALTKDTTVVGQIDNSSLKWIERTLGQIKKKFPSVEADSRGNTITIRGKLADVSAVCDAYPKGISHLHQDKGGDFLPNAAGDDLDYGEVDKVLSESKKSEGLGDFLDAKIDYNMFMRMCKTAAYLEEDEDYWDALWDFYSEVGSIGDALVFFDNLFQYTAWMDVDETYDELAESDQDGSKSKEECIEAVLDRDGEIRGSLVRNYGDHYLWVY